MDCQSSDASLTLLDEPDCPPMPIDLVPKRNSHAFGHYTYKVLLSVSYRVAWGRNA